MYNSQGPFFNSIPPITKNLLIINVLCWFASLVLPKFGINLETLCGLHYWGASQFNAAQIITYMFMHDTSNFLHLFFNMFSLWMFGRALEMALGGKRFLFYYITCGIGAAFVQELVWTLTWRHTFVPALANLNGITFEQMNTYINQYIAEGKDLPFLNQMVTIGASGSVFGVLLAFGMIFPNLPLFLMFIPVPIKAKYMVIGYGLIELFCGVTNSLDGIAHFAHLGGMIFGFLVLIYWKKKGMQGGRNN